MLQLNNDEFSDWKSKILTSKLLVAAIGFFAAVRAASVFAFVQLYRNVDLAMRQRGATNPTPTELAALTEGLKTIREPIEHEYKRAQLQSDFLCERVKDAGSLRSVMRWVLV